MDQDIIADKINLTELSNKLFMYTDSKEWDKLMDEVFKETIWFDVSSNGGDPASHLKAQEICDMWKQGLADTDAVHHQAGHYIITVKNDAADIYGYAVATHYKKAAIKGAIRTFVGSYDLKAERGKNGWRLSQFKYNLKYADGNLTLE